MAVDEAESPRHVIETAATEHDVDLDHAVVARDPDPASSRVYIIEERADADEYRLIAYGLDGNQVVATEDPITIPSSAVGPVQGLLHVAGLHVNTRNFITDPQGQDTPSITQVSEEGQLSEAMEAGPHLGDPRHWGVDEPDTEEDAGDGQ